MEFSGSTKTKKVYLEHRTKTSVQRMEQMLFEKVWYIRHQNLKQRIKDNETTCAPDIWKGALKAAKEIEKKHGIENLYYNDDFEWGMVNGKLSAIRWFLGDEWDFLDT
jgi:hypothetical protein